MERYKTALSLVVSRRRAARALPPSFHLLQLPPPSLFLERIPPSCSSRPSSFQNAKIRLAHLYSHLFSFLSTPLQLCLAVLLLRQLKLQILHLPQSFRYLGLDSSVLASMLPLCDPSLTDELVDLAFEVGETSFVRSRSLRSNRDRGRVHLRRSWKRSRRSEARHAGAEV